MKKTNDLFPTWIRVPAQIFPTVNKWKKKSHRHRNASGDERVARKRKKKNVFSLSLSRTGSLCYASSCVARAHSYASGVKILFFIFLACFLGNTRHKREMKQTRKKTQSGKCSTWVADREIVVVSPTHRGGRKKNPRENETHLSRFHLVFFFAFGNPGYTFRVF